MTKVKHPSNRHQRLVLVKKKQIEKKKVSDPQGHVWKRLRKENIKEKETHDELKEYQGH